MTVGWQMYWPRVPYRPEAAECSRWTDDLKGVVWTELRVPSPVAIRLAARTGVAP